MYGSPILLKKKSLFMLAVILMLSNFLGIFGSRAMAADSGTLLYAMTDNASPKVGDTVTVSVKLTGNTGFAALQFDVTYDTAVLSCTGCRRGVLLKDATLAAANPNDDGAVTVASATLKEIESDGVAAVVTFNVIGRGDAKLNLSLTEICDSEYKSLSCAVSADKIIAAAGNGSSDTGAVTGPATAPDAGGGEWNEYEDTSAGSGSSSTGGGSTESGGSSNGGSGSGTAAVTNNSQNTKHLFSDTTGHWAESDINSITEKGIITGFEDGSFKPNDKMTRAQFAVILWRMAGMPEPSGKTGVKFKDLTASWYEKAAVWANELGYINGDGERFLPDNNISRQELVTILFRYSGGVSGMELMLTKTYDSIFKDSGEIAGWGRNPIYWAVYNSIITGIDDTTLSPNGKATRAQVAAIIARFLNMKDRGTDNLPDLS
jgi:uncharacterized membrane protein YgcG